MSDLQVWLLIVLFVAGLPGIGLAETELSDDSRFLQLVAQMQSGRGGGSAQGQTNQLPVWVHKVNRHRITYGLALGALLALPLVAWGLMTSRPSGLLAQRGPFMALLGLVVFLACLILPAFKSQLTDPVLQSLAVDGGLAAAGALLILLVSGGSAVTARDRGATILEALWVAVLPTGIIVATRMDDPDA